METLAAKTHSHPLRSKILALLAEEEPRSPQALATAIGEHLHNVSYHVKRLQQLGAVELVQERQVRGAVEHFYSRTAAMTRLDAGTALDQIQRVCIGVDCNGADADTGIVRIMEILAETGREV